jgi:sulfur-oxidizing protein SoxB
MLSRRDFLQVSAATLTALGAGMPLGRRAAAQSIGQDDLLAFEPFGNVTLLNFTDLHAQLVPLYFREPSVNIGVGEVEGLPPHITGKAFLERFNLKPGSLDAYALASTDFVELARQYGRVGGLDRMATLIKAIRAERPDNTLVLDGGDTWQGSYTSLKTEGGDMVRAMNALGVDAMTAHWEFTYGQDRVQALVEEMDFPFLAGNVRDTTWEEPVFEAATSFERGGKKIAVIGQAFPYTPIANPGHMIPEWSFGIREEAVAASAAEARAGGADLVVLLSHNGFDVDRKLARRVDGIDVILTGHTHDAIPEVLVENGTLLVASGSHGKFLARLDLDVGSQGVKDYRFKLIPVLADAIRPDPEMAALVAEIRAPHAAEIDEVLGHTEGPLYRRGNFNGTFDDLICQALMAERDAEIALSPGFRWGASLLPGQPITRDDVYNMTAITYPNAYRQQMTGETLKLILDMTHLASGTPIEASKEYTVAGWASVNPGTEGPPVYDLVTDYIRKTKAVSVPRNDSVRVVGV